MKIAKVSATTHRVPITVPLLDKPINREIVFVRVETDEGLTGYGMAEDRERSRAAGFDLHLVKPIDPAALRSLLVADAAP